MPFAGKEVKPPPEKKDQKPKPVTTADSKVLAKRTEGVEGGFQIVALAATAVGYHADAAAIGMHAEAISPEVAKLADENAAIAKGIDFITENGPYAALITVSLPLVLQLCVNHGLIKAEKFAGSGVVNPGVLEAQYKLRMTQKATEMLKEQKRLEDELIVAQMEFQDELVQAQNRAQITNAPADTGEPQE